MLACFGSPLLDIIATANKSILDKYNLKENEAEILNENLHNIELEIHNLNPSFQVGGSITNTIKIINKFCCNSVQYFGAIGNDEYGIMIKEKLTSEGINFHFKEHESISTGKCFVLLTENSRTLVTDLGASKYFNESDLDEINLNQFSSLYMSTFFINVSFAVVQNLIKHFKKDNKLIFVNLGASFLCEKKPEEVKFMTANSNILFGNEREFLALGTVLNLNTKIFEDMLLEMNNLKKSRILVVTRGSESVLSISNDKIDEFKVNCVSSEKIKTCNGAGDAFVGGFLAKYLNKQNLTDCINFGIEIAGLCIQNIDYNKIF